MGNDARAELKHLNQVSVKESDNPKSREAVPTLILRQIIVATGNKRLGGDEFNMAVTSSKQHT